MPSQPLLATSLFSTPSGPPSSSLNTVTVKLITASFEPPRRLDVSSRNRQLPGKRRNARGRMAGERREKADTLYEGITVAGQVDFDDLNNLCDASKSGPETRTRANRERAAREDSSVRGHPRGRY